MEIGQKYLKVLKCVLSVVFGVYISWYLILYQGLAVYQDINDLVYHQWPEYQDFKVKEAKAYETLQITYKEKNQGLEGYLREILQEKSKYIEAMCTCGHYNEMYCQDNLSLANMLHLIKSDPIFQDELDNIYIYS